MSTFFRHLTTVVVIVKDGWTDRQVLKDSGKSFNRSLIHIKALLLSLLNIYVNFDFFAAQKKTQCSSDYFLRISLDCLSLYRKTLCHIGQCNKQ